jgi:hypothetical protein
VTRALLAGVVLVMAGLPLAYAVVRRILFALLLAPLAGALAAAVAVILMLASGVGNLLLWLMLVLLAEIGFTAWILRRGGTGGTPLPYTSWADVLCYALPLGLPLLLIVNPPNAWDEHSVWWLHAAGYTRSAEFARQMLNSSGLVFSHLDYPPLTSAAVAAAWRIMGGHDFRVAQVANTLVTVSAITLLAYAIRRVTGQAPAVVSRLAAIGVALAVWSNIGASVTSGYADPAWSATFVAGVVLVLFGADPYARPALPVLVLTAAALTKNEGLFAVAVLALLATVRDVRSARIRVVWLWLPVAAGLCWRQLALALGAESDVGSSGDRLSLLIGGDPAVTGRIRPTLDAIWQYAGPPIAAALAVAVIGHLFLSRRRRAMGIGGDLWGWAVLVTYGLSLLLTYVLSTYEIDWYLRTSANRVTLVMVLIACASAAVWAGVAITAGLEQLKQPDNQIVLTLRNPPPAGFSAASTLSSGDVSLTTRVLPAAK